jgi:hypothetical protein
MSKRPAPADPQGNGSPHKRTAQQTHIEYRKRQIRNVLPRIRAGDFDLDATVRQNVLCIVLMTTVHRDA